MFGPPDDNLGDDRHEISAFSGKAINEAPAIFGIAGLGDYAGAFEMLEPVGQNIGGYALINFKKFAVGLFTVQHHLAQDQKTPSVSEDIEAVGYGASGLAHL